MTRLSVLDLSPICVDSAAAESFGRSVDLARLAERVGYRRFWLAEHHGMPGIASAATSVLIGHVAGRTERIRVGAGGIMLPNHSPLVIAEQFGTLESLYPGRIDLGLGRAPGSDSAAMRAMRTDRASAERFPDDVVELMKFFAGESVGGVQAVPGAGLDVPIWILGSSLFGAQLAARLGLPYAFASHFAPQQMMEAIDEYRSSFRPSAVLQRPYLMLGFNVFAADDLRTAQVFATSWLQAFVQLRRGRPGKLPAPVPDYVDTLDPQARALIDSALVCSAVGEPETVFRRLDRFVEMTGADELMIATLAYDHRARLRSYEIAAQWPGMTQGEST